MSSWRRKLGEAIWWAKKHPSRTNRNIPIEKKGISKRYQVKELDRYWSASGKKKAIPSLTR